MSGGKKKPHTYLRTYINKGFAGWFPGDGNSRNSPCSVKILLKFTDSIDRSMHGEDRGNDDISNRYYFGPPRSPPSLSFDGSQWPSPLSMPHEFARTHLLHVLGGGGGERGKKMIYTFGHPGNFGMKTIPCPRTGLYIFLLKIRKNFILAVSLPRIHTHILYNNTERHVRNEKKKTMTITINLFHSTLHAYTLIYIFRRFPCVYIYMYIYI